LATGSSQYASAFLKNARKHFLKSTTLTTFVIIKIFGDYDHPWAKK
jgi:hypothetical protein